MVKLIKIYSKINNITYTNKGGELISCDPKYYKHSMYNTILHETRTYTEYAIIDGKPQFMHTGTTYSKMPVKGYYITVDRKPNYVRCSLETTPKDIKAIFPEYGKGNFTLNRICN